MVPLFSMARVKLGPSSVNTMDCQYELNRYAICLLDSCEELFESQRQKTYLGTCAPSEDSDQPAYSCSLIRIVNGCILDGQGCSFFIATTKIDLSRWVG